MIIDCFISYSTSDKSIADAICDRMEKGNLQCWIAPRNVRPGHNFADEIIDAIDEAKAMAVVISASSNASRHVVNEVATALEFRRTVIPFRVEDQPLTGALSYHLSQLHWLDATTPPIEAHIDDLVQTLSQLIQSTHATVEVQKLNRKELQVAISERNPGLPNWFEKLRLAISTRRRMFKTIVEPLHQRTEPVCRAYLEMFHTLRQNLEAAVAESDLKAVIDIFYHTRSKVVFERSKILPWYTQRLDHAPYDFEEKFRGHLIRLEHIGDTRDDLMFLAATLMKFFFLMPSHRNWSDSVVSRAGNSIYLLRSLSSRGPTRWAKDADEAEMTGRPVLPPLADRLKTAIDHVDFHITELETYWEAHCNAYERLRERFE
jgi:hypothetical protein